jgi:glycosyltransferase involved in cell wall biosynthesis
VLANSQVGIEFHRGLGYRPRRWLYFPNSLDLDEFCPDANAAAWLRAQLSVSPGTAMIGYIARFHPVKDHATFIAAASRLLATDPTVHFVLVGRDINVKNASLMELIASAGAAEHFHLLDHRTDANRITAALDISCFSSLGEGSSNVVAEAMACGTPCVATDVGDASLILQNTGKVVPPKQPQAIAEACRNLLSLPADQRGQLRVMARARVEDCFSPLTIVARFEKLYEELRLTSRATATSNSTHHDSAEGNFV